MDGDVPRFEAPPTSTLRKGSIITLRFPGEGPVLMRVTSDPAPMAADEGWPGGVTFDIERVDAHPVGPSGYASAIPRDDQDADARCPATGGGSVPAQAVRAAADTDTRAPGA